MEKHTYKTSGTCSKQIDFELDGNTVHNVKFTFGCNGNTQGVAALVEVMAEGSKQIFYTAVCRFRECSGQEPVAFFAGGAEAA